jgi:magnesium transporter
LKWPNESGPPDSGPERDGLDAGAARAPDGAEPVEGLPRGGRNVLGGLIAPDVGELLEARRYNQARRELMGLEPADIADVFSALGDEQEALAFRLLPHDLAADVFAYLDPESQEALLSKLTNEQAARILNEMDPDDRTALLEELPGPVARRLIAMMDPKERAITQAIFNYPPDTVGRLMSPDYVRVKPDWTVSHAIEHIRRVGKDAETVNVIYVTDERGILIDDLRIRQFLLAAPDQTVSSLMDGNFTALRATDDQAEAVRVLRKYDRSALPVVDSRGVLLGLVTADDVADVAEEEATEDIQKLGGMEALGAPYLAVPFRTMIQKRAGWLAVLFVGEMMTATAMGFFQHEIATAVVLALFVPLIISSGGNSGSQAASLMIRALALGEVTLRDWWRIFGREIRNGLALGGVLGGIGVLRVLLWDSFGWTDYGPHVVLIALTVGLSLIGVVTWGTLSGSMLPFLLKRLGFDPATSSAPFVATLVDVTGLVIYFTIAAALLRGTLL